MKLENLMLFAKKESFEVVLIDYGTTTFYQDLTGEHIEQTMSDDIPGNLPFASLDSLKSLSLSRRNDLQSLCYMMIYVLNGQ